MFITNDWWEKKEEIRKSVGEKFQHSSPMQATNIQKIILNSGVGNNKQFLDNTKKILQQIAQGQKPVETHAKKSIVSFNLREGVAIGCKVTLRRKKAWNFLFELVNITLPRMRDFRGLSSNGFDHHGNYNLGIKDLSVFPAASYDLTFNNQGCQIIIVFKSRSLEENKYFLELLNFPFHKA